MKNLLVGLLIICAFAAGYLFSQKYNLKLEPKTQVQVIISPTNQPLVGNDVDVHGCKGSAGYTWCEPKQKCLRIFEEKCEVLSPTPTVDETESLKTVIKQLLIQEHGSSANGLIITVSKMTGDYAKGGASEQGGGGIWLAAKINNQWQLVFDGNGVPDCQNIKANYKFPADILTNICD